MIPFSFASSSLWGSDALLWRTAENGKRYQIDTESGEIVAGNLGQKREKSGYQSLPLTSSRPDAARYAALLREHGGDHKKAAHAYFREKLQGRHVDARTDEGTIQATFTGGTWSEIKKNMRDDPVKAALVPHMPDIIATGRHAEEEPAHSHPDVSVFHTFRKIVDTAEGPREVIVDVAERPESEPKNTVYNLTREGTSNYKGRQQQNPTGDHRIKKSGFISVSCGHSEGEYPPPYTDKPNHIMRNKAVLVEDNLSPRFEVVNLRLADELDERALVSAIVADMMRALRRERDAALARDAKPAVAFSLPKTGPFAGLNLIKLPDTGDWA